METKSHRLRGKKYPLVQLIKLKTGKNISQLSSEMDIYYHSLIKTLWKLPKRKNLKIRARLAERLGVSYDDLWGERSEERINALIKEEVRRITLSKALEYQSKLLEKVLS